MSTEQDFYFHVGLHSRFFVEQRSKNGWMIPPTCSPLYGMQEQPGMFFGIWEQARLVDLFWGPHSLFAMRHGFPPERERSELCRWIETQWREGLEDYNVCWLPAEELLLDDWQTTWLTVAQEIPARYAGLFGNGRERFPEKALGEAGYDASDRKSFRRGAYTVEAAIDYTFGKHFALRRNTPPDDSLPVTWLENVEEYIGEEGTAAFHSLRQLGRAEELRIVVFSTP